MIETTYSTSESPQYTEFKELYENNKYIDNSTNNYIDDIASDRGYILSNIDYTKALSGKTKMELGLEYRKDYSETSNKTTQTDSDDSKVGDSTLDYRRNIYSAYLNINHRFGDALALQTGFRAEQYSIEADFGQEDKYGIMEEESIADEIFSVYPSAFFTFTPSEENQFQLSYSYRVDRPSVRQLNPIKMWSTTLKYSVGNPNLKPQFTNSYEFNYTRKLTKGSVTLGVFFRRVKDNISRIYTEDTIDENKIKVTYANMETSDRSGIELSANYSIASWWRLNMSADLYKQTEIGYSDLERLEVENSVVNTRLSNNFNISRRFKMQLSAMYRGKNISIQSVREPMYSVNTGASYSIFKNKGTLNLRINDVFDTMKYKYESTIPYIQRGEYKWESRSVSLSFAYRFGSGKNKSAKRRNRDSGESREGGGEA